MPAPVSPTSLPGLPGRLFPTRFVAALCGVVLIVSACGSGDDSSATRTTGPDETAGGESTATGSFVVQYEKRTTEEGEAARELLKSSGVVDATADTMNKIVALPEDVPIVVGDQIERDGEVLQGPAAVPNEIVFPTQFITETQADNAAAAPDETPEEVAGNTAQTAQFALYHEMGHVLVQVLDIPITGNEEDAVDQFAVVMLAVASDDEDQLVEAADVTLAAADSFEAVSFEPGDEEWWDEHTITQQRTRTLVCLAAGSSEPAYEALTPAVPEERLVRCPSEFQQAFTSWLRLLEGHYQPGVQDEVDATLTQANEAAEVTAEGQ